MIWTRFLESVLWTFGMSIETQKRVICIDGDGSFLMTLSDMKTAKQYDLKNLKV